MHHFRCGFLAAGLVALPFAAPAFAAAPLDCSTAAIPPGPVKGSVGGKPFVPKSAEVVIGKGFAVNQVKFDSYDLTLEVDGVFNALTVRVIGREGTNATGRAFRLLPTDSIGAQPMAYPGTPEVQGWDLHLEAANVDTSFTQETASMRLEYGPRKGNVLPGKIMFCAPDEKATIAGSFDAVIRK
ncbi:MAG: hypothetical protein KGJ49_06535 [Alphaproteobacteria bacterium]|nr:hypothetical protein [Alphaproteobacteria bacterium]